jgi:hypothetical protein
MKTPDETLPKIHREEKILKATVPPVGDTQGPLALPICPINNQRASSVVDSRL